MVLFRASAWLGVWFLVSCGGTPPPRIAAAPPPTAATPTVVATPGAIQRAELDVVLGRGLGAFLGTVRVEAALRAQRFVGYRVVELRDHDLYAGVDLRTGDTITAVNGMPIERPEQAFEAWSSLRVASELTVELLRGDELRQLRYPIVD